MEHANNTLAIQLRVIEWTLPWTPIRRGPHRPTVEDTSPAWDRPPVEDTSPAWEEDQSMGDEEEEPSVTPLPVYELFRIF